MRCIEVVKFFYRIKYLGMFGAPIMTCLFSLSILKTRPQKRTTGSTYFFSDKGVRKAYE